MSGHTPEPVAWFYTHAEFSSGIYLSRWDKDGGGTSNDFIGWNEHPLYKFADMNPDAYRELIAALEAIESGTLPDGFTAKWSELREIARAAIAKAKGETA